MAKITIRIKIRKTEGLYTVYGKLPKLVGQCKLKRIVPYYTLNEESLEAMKGPFTSYYSVEALLEDLWSGRDD